MPSSRPADRKGTRSPRGTDGKPFVGREREMARLRGALDEATAGRGRIVLLSGEPGVGKSRVAEELCVRAQARGVDAVWGSCFDREGAPPYWPWSEVVRGLIGARGQAAVRRCMAQGLSHIALMIPAAEPLASEREPGSTGGDPITARFRFFDATASFLRRASAEAPMVVVLDDLHWADEGTLLLLSFVSRDVADSRMLVVGTYRDMEARGNRLLGETLGDLARSRAYEQVALPPLGLEDIRSYLAAAAAAPGAHEGGTAEAVLARTEGNAFLVTEVVRLLEENGDPGTEGHGPPVPATVLEVMGRRLGRLDPECRSFLTVAAGLGREFAPRVVERCMEGVDREESLRLLDEAAAAALVQETAGGEGRWRFSHVLTQQSILSGLAAGERTKLHAHIVDALKAEYGADVDAHARELVEHLESARAILGTEDLERYLALAGEQALAVYAYEEARSYLERALTIRGTGTEDARTADLLSLLARAQVSLQDEGALETLKRAGALYVRAGLPDRVVAMLACPFSAFPDRRGELFALFEVALERVEEDSGEESRILVKRYFIYFDRLDPKAERSRFERALRAAEARGSIDDQVFILMSLAIIAARVLDYGSLAHHAERAYELALRSGDPLAQCAALMAMANRHKAVGAPVVERELGAERMRVAAETLRDRRWLHIAYSECQGVAWSKAEWRRAIEWNDHLLATARPGSLDVLTSFHRTVFEYELGRTDEGDRFLAEAVERIRSEPGAAYERSAAAEYMGRVMLMSSSPTWLDAAEGLCREVLSRPDLPPVARQTALCARGTLAVLRGDAEAAAPSYQALLPALGTSTALRSGYLVGLLARAAGDTEAALGHLRAAVDLGSATGGEGLTAWQRFYLAETLVQRSGCGDRAEAESILAGLLEHAARTESVLLGARAGELLEQLRAPRHATRAASGTERPAGLTEREVEILRAVAAGKTNKEIGVAFGITTTTVNAHLRSILGKTDTANRAEATSFAARHGLLGDPPAS